MAEDRSLTDFASATEGPDEDAESREADDEESDGIDEEGEHGEDTGEPSGAGGDTDVRDPDAVDPAASTYDWSPDGTACEACGTVVERRWIDGDARVCGDCKEW